MGLTGITLTIKDLIHAQLFGYINNLRDNFDQLY